MQVQSIGYVGILASDVSAWRKFAYDVFGLQVEDTPGGLTLRIDECVHRILIHPRERNGLAYIGFDMGDAERLAAAAAELTAGGIHVERATTEDLSSRRVTQMFWLSDPLGNRVELFHGLAVAAQPFSPACPTRGFRTGELGFGHVVLTVPRVDDVLPFYRDVLGMRMSDYTSAPFRAEFLHVNARHHSLALLETGQSGLHHLMIEALSIDDLGRAYDAAVEHDVVRVTLGRHTNDHMMSFYAASPSGFMMEYGWGGRNLDEATWKVEEMVHGPSIWGHERLWLSDEKRAEARELRLQAAAAGLRAPLHVVSGEFEEADDSG